MSQIDFDLQWKNDYKKDILSLAIKINEKVLNELGNDEYLVRVHPNALPPPESKAGRNLFPCLSNFGKLDEFFGSSEYELKGLYTTIACKMFGPATLCHLATVKNQFYFTFTSIEPIHSKDRLMSISDQTISILQEFIQ